MAYSHSITNQKQLIKVDGKIIGTLEGNRFVKPVKGSKHQLKYPPAWAIDANAFDNEILPSASEVVIHDKETGIKYHTSVDSFDRQKRSFDRGFGRQYYLTLNYWATENNGNGQLRLFGEEVGRNA